MKALSALDMLRLVRREEEQICRSSNSSLTFTYANFEKLLIDFLHYSLSMPALTREQVMKPTELIKFTQDEL
ncbi:hypothetical protein ACTXT7_008125 [Hymenolepis weldensis]